jgi:hypothetical protein
MNHWRGIIRSLFQYRGKCITQVQWKPRRRQQIDTIHLFDVASLLSIKVSLIWRHRQYSSRYDTSKKEKPNKRIRDLE